MAWYKTGTVAVTNGSATVTGSGTAFVANVQVGDVFHGPDERQYEIQSVNSDTQLTLASTYLGSTQSGQSYKIQPTRGVTASLLASVSSLISNFQGAANTALAGKFGNGSAAAPGITFDGDQDTGLFRKSANVLGFAVGGAEKANLSGSAFTVNVPIGGTAVQANAADTTAGRLLPVGAFGLGEQGNAPLALAAGTREPNGFYRATATDGIYPASVALMKTGFSAVRQIEFGGAVQSGYEGRFFGRTQNADLTWDDLVEFFTSANLLGTVSQSGGSPTGSAFESGSNANGYYSRLANGWQIGTVSNLTLSGSANTTWTFPAAMQFPADPGKPIVFGNVPASVASSYRLILAGTSSTTVTVNAVDATDARVATTANLIVIGRWF